MNMAKKRPNIIPIIEDARHPQKYRMLVPMVDVVFAGKPSFWLASGPAEVLAMSLISENGPTHAHEMYPCLIMRCNLKGVCACRCCTA